MVINKAFSTKARESSLAGIIGSHITDTSDLLNALDFVESPMGLSVDLYPVQRVLLKLSQGIPMDYKKKIVPVHDQYGEELLCELPETDYIKYAFDQGRLNIPDWRDASPTGYEELCILVGRRGGKAIALDEPIPTPDRGFVPNGKLQDGDMVFGPDGKPTRILHAHEPFEDQTYRVFFDDGTSVVTHGDHQWQTLTYLDRKRRQRLDSSRAKLPKSHRTEKVTGTVKTTLEIMETLHYFRKDKKVETNHFIPLAAPLELPERKLPLDPYFLGLWLGNGDASHPCITTSDPEIVTYLSEFAEGLGLKVRSYSKEGQKDSSYEITSGVHDQSWVGSTERNPILNSLGELGLLQNKHIPESYLWASREQRLALLQGLMDSNGSCTSSCCEFSSKNERLSREVLQLVCSLGIKARLHSKTFRSQHETETPGFGVTWISIMPCFRLSRKLAQLPQCVRTAQQGRFITDVQPEGRRMVRCITVEHDSHLFLFGENFNVTHNSQLVSAITAYRLYKLLSIRDPQAYYGLVSGSPIDVVLMAQDEDGAGRLFKKLREDVLRSPFFATYLRSTSNNDLRFVTENDRNKRDPTPTILVDALACTTRAARGPSACVLCLDEFAHFKSASGANSSEVYDAATPSTLQFKHPETGAKDSQVIIVTSPLKRVGKYYDVYKHGMEKGAKGTVLSFRCSTAEMNPNTPKGSLRVEAEKSPISFRYEFGGEFADSSESFVKAMTLDLCVDPNRANVTHFSPNLIGHKYFWGFDLGMRKDASALSIGHWEFRDGKPCLVYDYIDRLMVGEGQYENEVELQLEHIIQWLNSMHQLLPCFQGATDQHGGTMLVQLLKAYGIEGMELLSLTDQINSKMYHALKLLVDQKAARFPDVPKFITEVKLLEAEVMSKYRIKVQAPMEKGSHDDMADSAALVAMLAVDWAQGEGAHEMRDLVQNPQLFNQAQQMAMGSLNLDIQHASLSDLRLLERQAQARKNQMAMVRQGYGISPHTSKYRMAQKRRG